MAIEDNMGADVPPSFPRSRPRAYLLLARVSNLPTIWTNVVAGAAAAGWRADWPAVVQVMLAASCFYTGGMFLNDAFDEPFDRRVRPERPIPAGNVSRREAFAVGAAFLVAGELLLAPHGVALALGALLAAAIVLYDARHKQQPLAPLVMGLCRALVYLVAAAAVGSIGAPVWVAAAVLLVYVAGLTVVARLAGANARWLVPLLIAGISIVDAGVIVAVSGMWLLALAATAGFAATLFLQRWVPGD
jgi:4-hydroxybenzoate polyprenyltransferase